MKSLKFSSTLALILIISSSLMLTFSSCSDDDDGNTEPETFNLKIKMNQTVNGQNLVMNTPDMPYTNERGQKFNVSRLRYLISKLHFHRADGTNQFVDGFFFVDVSDSSSLTFQPTTPIPAGSYTSISFYFGFDEEDNAKDFPELNILNWNWPDMLGGGYHNMRLEGQYDSVGTAKNFATHFGTARNTNASPTEFRNTATEMEFGGNFEVNRDMELIITMQVEQWYENPFQWDFNVWNVPIMPIFDAQIELQNNSSSVFTVELN